jgi:WD40 repeat protein
VFSASNDESIRVWNRNADCIQILEHNGGISCLTVLGNYLISGGNECSIQVTFFMLTLDF